jgi:signal transduction histidine kinase
VWVAHRDAGVLRVVDEHLVPLAKTNSRHFDDITLLHAASDGGLWVIYNGGREIGVIDSAGQVIDDVKGRPPLGPTSVITAVVETRSKDLWFATTTGILRFRRGTWSEFGSAQGLPAQEVTAIAEDNRGSLWLAMAVGPLLMIDPSSADAVAAGHEGVLRYVTLDQSDGVAGVAVRRPGPRVVRADNGTLWFTTGRGMTVVDPRTARASVAAPDGLVAIEEAVVDDRPVSVTPMAMLPPNVGRMRIDYTALNVRWPGRFRFRYRLDGFDTEWTDAGTARQATYTNLGPGHYRFQVEAQSEKSRQTLLANAWEFSVAPAFYQTRTFAVAVIAALGLALWGAWQLRLLQVRRRFAQVLAERARMSRELHDTLLQSLAGVALQIGDAVADLDHDPDVVRAQLARIRKQVEQHTAEAASTITQLRSPLLRDHDLPAAIREMIRRVTEGQPWQVDVNVTGRVGELPEVVQHHVLRVAQEALTNVVRHAHASQVAVVVRFEPAQVLLEVSDDGAGFIPEEVPLGDRTHFGLTMMRERAEQVGGRLTIESGGRGTRVILTVPRAARLRKVS